jgi:hypothetical protein
VSQNGRKTYKNIVPDEKVGGPLALALKERIKRRGSWKWAVIERNSNHSVGSVNDIAVISALVSETADSSGSRALTVGIDRRSIRDKCGNRNVGD